MSKKLLTFRTHLTYEPELFPGIYYREKGSNMVIILFHSGKYIITGGKCLEQMISFEKTFLNIIKKCIK